MKKKNNSNGGVSQDVIGSTVTQLFRPVAEPTEHTEPTEIAEQTVALDVIPPTVANGRHQPGAVVTLSDDDAQECFRLNRNIVHAQAAMREEFKKLEDFAKELAPRYGISLDAANGRWNFDAGAGTFTRQYESVPQPVAKA